MHIRRLFAIFSLILIGGILVACGAGDDDDSPTATVMPTTAPADAEPTETTEPTEPVADDDAEATPDGTPAATPVSAAATPLTDEATPVSAAATPLTDEATPVSEAATPLVTEATPAPDVVVPPPVIDEEESTPVLAAPESTPVAMVDIAGTLTLDGRAQQDYTLGPEGCVGLGEWRQLKPGTQVIVRDATGTVVDIAELEGQDNGDQCAWTFAIEIPGADFFSISIPMVTEVWFDQNDPAVQSGELELFVP